MSLSIATSNLVKSSVSKPDSVISGQSVAVPEQAESGESKLFSETLDATLSETMGKQEAKVEQADKTSTDAITIGSELNAQTSEQSLLSDAGDEIETSGEDVSVNKLSPNGQELATNELKHSAAQSSEVEGENNPSQIDSEKLVANKTISESAQLLARLDESSKALKSDQSAKQSDTLRVAAVSTKENSVLSAATNLADSSSDSTANFTIDKPVTKLTQLGGELDGEIQASVQEQNARLDSDKAEPSFVTSPQSNIGKFGSVIDSQSEISASANATDTFTDKTGVIDLQSKEPLKGVNAAQINQVQAVDDVANEGIGTDGEMPQGATSHSITNVSIGEQNLEIAATQQKSAIQWKTGTNTGMDHDVVMHENQQLHAVQGLSPARSDGENIELTSDPLDVPSVSIADDMVLNEAEQVISQQAASAIKPTSELQWSTQDTQPELMDALNAKPTKPLVNMAGALANAQVSNSQVTNAQATSSNTSQLLRAEMLQAESMAGSNLSPSATSDEGKLIHQSAHLAEFSANAAITASSSTAQSASLAASAAAIGAGARKQGASEISDINAASGSASSATAAATQLNMARAEQAQQPATPQSPLMLTKEHAAEQMSERLQMMMSKNLKHVDIRLDPPELGRMQIRMTLNSDSASVHFTVQNQQTREMVDQAMPRLREMLSQQGITLADTSVQQQNSGQQRDAQQTAQGAGQGSGSLSRGQEDADTIADETSTVNVAVRHSSDGISYYA